MYTVPLGISITAVEYRVITVRYTFTHTEADCCVCDHNFWSRCRWLVSTVKKQTHSCQSSTVLVPNTQHSNCHCCTDSSSRVDCCQSAEPTLRQLEFKICVRVLYPESPRCCVRHSHCQQFDLQTGLEAWSLWKDFRFFLWEVWAQIPTKWSFNI